MKLKITLIFFIVLSIYGCNNSSKDANQKQSKSIPKVKPIKVYSIKGKGIELRKGAGENFEKIVNQKASSVTKNTVYVSVDYTCKVRIESEKDGWSKITVVEPSYLSSSHKGWMKSESIIKSREKSKPEKSKIEVFNNVNELKTVLSKNGIGALRNWRGDELGWFSSSDYFSFGNQSNINGMQNNLAYYLENRQKTFVKELKIILNINNAKEKKQGLSKLKIITLKTFKSLSLEIPNGLLTNISKGKEFQAENEYFFTKLELDKSKIDTWKLTIESQIK